MLLRAPAKINLTLKVLSRRADGYHEISSKMRALRLYDEVELLLFGEKPNNKKRAVNICLKHSKSDSLNYCPEIPDGPENLAWRAAELAVAELADNWSGEIGITLKKGIPVAAGLGGGSSDAAAVILGIAKKTAPEAEIRELADLGARIGADVPFCVFACAEANPALGYTGMKAALAEGVGEAITPEADPESARIVLVKPGIEIKTGEIYKRLDDIQSGKGMIVDKGMTAGSGSLSRNNDLELPCATMYPAVDETIAMLKDICKEEYAGSAKVQLSGSGPTVFVYFGEDSFGGDAKTLASRIYKKAEKVFPDCFVCLTKTL